jgi:hypothetical protein
LSKYGKRFATLILMTRQPSNENGKMTQKPIEIPKLRRTNIYCVARPGGVVLAPSRLLLRHAISSHQALDAKMLNL